MEISNDKLTMKLGEKTYDFVKREKDGNCRLCEGCDSMCHKCEIPIDQCKGGEKMMCVDSVREDHICGYWKKETLLKKIFG